MYTRQAISGIRLDQSRLDRIYSSNRGGWFHHVKVLEHDGHQTLSDPIPMTITLVLEEEPVQGRRKGTYLKMDHSFLEDEDFRSKVQIEWDQCQADNAQADPRIC